MSVPNTQSDPIFLPNPIPRRPYMLSIHFREILYSEYRLRITQCENERRHRSRASPLHPRPWYHLSPDFLLVFSTFHFTSPSFYPFYSPFESDLDFRVTVRYDCDRGNLQSRIRPACRISGMILKFLLFALFIPHIEYALDFPLRGVPYIWQSRIALVDLNGDLQRNLQQKTYMEIIVTQECQVTSFFFVFPFLFTCYFANHGQDLE